MENQSGKRRHYADVGGITEFELMQIRREGNVSEEHLKSLSGYFEKIRKVIHEKWEIISISDDETSKILKHQLTALNELERLMSLDVSRGKQASKKLEDRYANR